MINNPEVPGKNKIVSVDTDLIGKLLQNKEVPKKLFSIRNKIREFRNIGSHITEKANCLKINYQKAALRSPGVPLLVKIRLRAQLFHRSLMSSLVRVRTRKR